MGRFNWGSEGPPDDAYSRVTEPERFKPLHDWALEAVARLQANYEVTLEEGEGFDTELERFPLSRPTIKLTPLQGSCAPITIAFTDSLGLRVRFGRWATEPFPDCMCDAYDELPEEEFERFSELLNVVVAGSFRESLFLKPGGEGWRTRELRSAEHRSSEGSWEPRDKTLQTLNGEAKIVLEWMPWPPKPDDTPTR